MKTIPASPYFAIKSKRKPCISSAIHCGISSMRSIVYHQTAGKYTLTSDDMQPKGLMRYTLKRDDIPNLRFG